MISTSLKAAIAEPSAIIRCGLETTLKKIPGLKIQWVEIAGPDHLSDNLKMHRPDILIVNPCMLGCYTLSFMKEDCNCPRLKCIALLYALADQTILKQYDETISIYDKDEQIRKKLERMFDLSENESSVTEEQLTLSTREKEIVVGVVKGMTNKEIAEKLYLSTHTVITHRRNIAKKLQIHSASGLTIYAIVNKLVELGDIRM